MLGGSNLLLGIFNLLGQSAGGLLATDYFWIVAIGFGTLLWALYTGKPIWKFMQTAAVIALLLVFKDPLLGLVGGIQLSTNDMVRIGEVFRPYLEARDWESREKPAR